MVYISSDGRVVEQRSWSLRLIPNVVWEVINAVSLFVRTLIQPALNSRGTNHNSGRNQGSSWRSPPDMPRRRMGRIGTSLDCSSAPMPGG
ncbi:hypothetical protein CHUAL_003422 [Chamberlinius hualienensis]